MPSRTFIMQEEAKALGFQAQKHRFTLVMCGNAACFMTKPGLIYSSRNPRALKTKNNDASPTYWMHNMDDKSAHSGLVQKMFLPEGQVFFEKKRTRL